MENKLYNSILESVENSREKGQLTAHSTTRALTPFTRKLAKAFGIFIRQRVAVHGTIKDINTEYNDFIKIYLS